MHPPISNTLEIALFFHFFDQWCGKYWAHAQTLFLFRKWKKIKNVKYINNVIVHTIWIIQFHDQFLFSFRCGDRLLAVDGQSLENIPHHLAVTMLKRTSTRVVTEVVSWMGTELWYDMVLKISCLFTLFFSWNWFHGKGIKTKFWYTIHICSHVKRATSHVLQYPPQIFFFEWDSVIEKNHIPTKYYLLL